MNRNYLHARKISLAFFALAILSANVNARSADDVWLQALKAIKFAAISRGSVEPQCKPGNRTSTTPQYQMLCPKLRKIPDSVIENAALPYFKRHVSEDAAREAISFFSSEGGKAIQIKMIKNVTTGMYDHFNEEDSFVMAARDQSAYGKAFSRFASDKEQAAAVVRAMLDYIP